ncbi:MAG: DUF4350 domain-containing protein [Acidobacteria bacterium]|nr:DUF4350 domain-containing protein [Acidobacteriota bacterium]
MMRGRFLIILTVFVMLFVLVGLNAASYVRVEREGDSEFAPDRSTMNHGATGTRALYEYLEQSGHSVERWGLPVALLMEGAEAKPSTFVVVGRTHRPFEGDEVVALLRWVEGGGRLVLIDRSPEPDLLPTSGLWRVSAEVVEKPGPDVRPENVESMTRGVKPLAPTQPTPLTRDVAQVTRSRFAGRLHVYKSGLVAPVVAVSAPPRARGPVADVAPTPAPTDEEDDFFGEEETEPLPPPKPASVADPVPVAEGVSPAPVRHLPDGRGGEGALLVDYAYGRGRIVILSDPFIVSNAGLNRSDNLLLAANVVAGGGGGDAAGLIAFDEFHQGFGAARNRFFAYFAGTPILWLFAQGAFIVMAVVWTRGRRFARPLPAPHVDRRSKLEFVASMAELQQRARAYDLAVENIYGRTRRALARYGGVGVDAPPAELAARVAARSGRDARGLEALLRECEDAMAGAPLSARRALSLVAQLRDLERELGIRMRAREIRQAEAR